MQLHRSLGARVEQAGGAGLPAVMQLHRSLGARTGGGAAVCEARAPDRGSLPRSLQRGVEALSGLSMHDVEVYRDSPQPERVQADAYTYGTQIHVGPGAEEHLPHEAWHVVQQKQGRALPTRSGVNDDAGLEAEAERMGARARAAGAAPAGGPLQHAEVATPSVQRKIRVGQTPVANLGEFKNQCGLAGLTPQQEGAIKWLLRDEAVHEVADGGTFMTSLGDTGLVAALLGARFDIDVVQPAGVPAFLGDLQTPYMIQTPQMRGDMHDVRAVMAVDPSIKLVFCLTEAARLPDAGEILSFYSGLESRIVLVAGEPKLVYKAAKNHKKMMPMAGATVALMEAAAADAEGTRAKIKTAITGEPTEAEETAYREGLQTRGFKPGVPYCIVNYRDSGHKPEPGRLASHPELDTGTVGLTQLLDLVRKKGFVPVPMGSPPGDWSAYQPNLIDYFLWPCCRPLTPARNKRQGEYGLLRYLGEHYDVRALSMRSGVTDALVFAGIETISLDVFDAEDASWQRAALRDAIMPGVFHQGFFVRRDDREHGQFNAKWEGEFDAGNLKQIGALVDRFFGTGDAPRSGVTAQDPNSPFSAQGIGWIETELARLETLLGKRKQQDPKGEATARLAGRVKDTKESLKYLRSNFAGWSESQQQLKPQIPGLQQREALAGIRRALEDVQRSYQEFVQALAKLGAPPTL